MKDINLEPLIPPTFLPIVVRFADEGVPIACIARSFKEPAETIRLVLTEAKEAGTLIEMPKEDWPPTARRADRLPQHANKLDDNELRDLCVRVLRVTVLQGAILVLLLRRGEATKTMFHHVIEQQRATRQNQPDKIMEETDIKMVDVVMCNLRKKLAVAMDEVDGKQIIKTLWSRGYFLPKPMRDKIFKMLADFQPEHG
jgi:DNA-binding response OmpR family regulator